MTNGYDIQEPELEALIICSMLRQKLVLEIVRTLRRYVSVSRPTLVDCGPKL